MVILNKLLVFALFFSILVIFKYLFKFAQAFKNDTKMEIKKWDGLKFALAFSYVLTIIFTGLV